MTDFTFPPVTTGHTSPRHIVGREMPVKPCKNASKRHPDTLLSPAERAVKFLAFKGATHNFGASVPSKVVHVAKGWVRTV